MTTKTENTPTIAVLETDGYELKFYLYFSKGAARQSLNMEIEFSVLPELPQRISIKSEKIIVTTTELRRLSDYFKHHIQNLKVNANHESYTFTDYSLAYQIQALCGYASQNNEESYFSIISMLNIGKKNSSSSSTYIGGESIIYFSQVENFIVSLENMIPL
ncbi:MAG: hypothetical protein WBA13_10945 [Microcoleaceae cyanobacterium]